MADKPVKGRIGRKALGAVPEAPGGWNDPGHPGIVAEPKVVKEKPVKGRVVGREWSRAFLSAMAMLLLAMTVYLAFDATSSASRWDNAKEWLQTVLPAETAVLGSAIGFYFGRENSSDSG